MTVIDAWEDDPVGSVLEPPPPPNQPISRDLPDFAGIALKVAVAGTAPPPDSYPVDTPEFRYWALADALFRGASFWSGHVPAGTTWHPDNGTTLVAHPDDGEDFNAYYDRNGLHFFHGTVRGTTVYSGESPDVVCHELGHAVLDAIKPQLFDVASIEVAAFHESFADCSAILSNLQLPSMLTRVLADTNGRPWFASRLSRLAEDLGWAIRQIIPDGASPDCLRSAVNSFYYQDPASLPPRAPSSSLASEPHSFSRVFTGGFFRALGLMYVLQNSPTESALAAASHDAGRLLLEGVRRAPVVPAFMAQVAAHMVEADADLFGGRYRRAILNGFVNAGVLSVRSAAQLAPARQLGAAPALALAEEQTGPARTLIGGAGYGLPSDLIVVAATQPRRFGVAGGLPDRGDAPAAAPPEAAASFVEDLLRRGRIDPGDSDIGDAPIIEPRYSTHRLVPVAGGLELRRTRFDCGFGVH